MLSLYRTFFVSDVLFVTCVVLEPSTVSKLVLPPSKM